MKSKILTTLLILFFAVFIWSCSENTTNTNSTPQISSITPNANPVGYLVTITGSNFGSAMGTSTVSFNGADATASEIQFWSATTIKLFVPANAKTGKVFVKTSSGNSNEVDFTVVSAGSEDPWIQNLDIKIAQVTQKIGIYGKNFGAVQGNSYVEFNGTRAITYTAWTSTKITVVVPEGATTGKVVAFINGKSTNGVDFTVQSSNNIVSMVTIPGGSFKMGTDTGDEIDNKPAHKVNITSFLMSKTEITQKMWKTVMDNSNPSNPTEIGDDKPVEQVSFVRAIDFCNRLSKMEQRTPCYTVNGDLISVDWTADGYRLPTEAEWEYAAKGGQDNEYTLNEILSMAWCSDNASNHIQPSGQKTANKFGLYDMLGNVYEMCWDFYDASYYSGEMTDPRGPSTSETKERISRGGSYINTPELCGANIRRSYPSTNDNYNFNLGFRICRKVK